MTCLFCMENSPVHNKIEYPPMHTAEHLLNATMGKLFGCTRSRNSHIERKKGKCDYTLPFPPTGEQIQAIEDAVNTVINLDLPVTMEYMPYEQASLIADLGKLPPSANDLVRIVRIGPYDTCACIGLHVEHTAQVGIFSITSYDYDPSNQRLRLRFKLSDTDWQD